MSGFRCEWIAIVPAPLRWPSASPKKRSFAIIAMIGPVLENSSAAATFGHPASPREAARTVINILYIEATFVLSVLDDGNMWPRRNAFVSTGTGRARLCLRCGLAVAVTGYE